MNLTREEMARFDELGEQVRAAQRAILKAEKKLEGETVPKTDFIPPAPDMAEFTSPAENKAITEADRVKAEILKSDLGHKMAQPLILTPEQIVPPEQIMQLRKYQLVG